jgi:predicted ester cyclase
MCRRLRACGPSAASLRLAAICLKGEQGHVQEDLPRTLRADRNNKDAGAIERFIAPNYRGFDAAALISGIDGYKQHFATITTGFPDMRITIDVILDEGERVAARWDVKATHTGHFGEIPPTGLPIHVTGTAIVRIINDQLVEEHANSDVLGLLRQIGVMPGTVRVPPLFF